MIQSDKVGEIMGNTVRAENGVEVYETKIHYFADEYINALNDPESINNNPSLFTGMIKYIYKHLFKPGKRDKVLYNTNTVLDTGDIDTIDDIWSIYTELCYKYNKRPTLLNFSLLVGVSNDTFTTWEQGEYRGGGDGAGSAHSRTVKKWRKECESSLVDGATERNSVGCIFALKANYGYTETPQRIEITGANAPALSQEDIRQIADQAKRESLPEIIEGLPDE